MATSATLNFDLFARDHASGTFRKFGANVSQSNSSVSKLRSGVASLAKGFIALGVAYKTIEFGKEAVREASDLNESINAVNVSYGKNAKAVQRMGQEAATALGLSNSEFNSLAVRFSAFSKTISGGGRKTVGVLDDLTTRASDFASVMNLDVNQAAELFQSGLAGETEPLRRFGLDLSAAAVTAHAYKAGIAEAGAELTEQQKIQARYSLLMKQTAKTQGDFSKTSDQAANASRILGAQWDNLQAKIGTAVLPVLAKLATWGNTTLIPFLSDAWDHVSQIGSAFSGSGAKSSELAMGFQKIIAAGQQVWATLKPIAVDIYNTIKANWPQISATITSVLVSIAGTVTAFAELVGTLWSKWGDDLMRVAGRVFENIYTVIRNALNVIQGIIEVVTGIIQGDWSKVWQGCRRITQAMLNGIQVLMDNFLATAREVLSSLGGMIAGLFRSAWDKARTATLNGISKVVQYAKGIPARIVSAVGDLSRILYSAGQSAIQGLIDGIGSKAADLAGVLGDLTAKIPDWKGPLDKDRKLLEPGGKAIMDGLMDGIESRRKALQDQLAEITDSIKSSFGGSVFGQGLSSAKDMLLFARARRNDVRTLAGDIKKLTKWGLSDSLLRQLIESGDFAGVHALAQGGQRDVRQLNRIDRQTNRALNQIGDRAGGQLVDNKAMRDAVKDGVRDGMNGAKLKVDSHGNARLMIQGGV